MSALETRLVERDPAELQLGGEFDHVHYFWRPYDRRDAAARADYDRLRESLAAAGRMVNPLIAFRDCVLIGQRRCEIARDLGWPSVPCWEILDDITADPTPGRVLALRNQYRPVTY